MDKYIKESIEEFEKFNEIKISNYQSRYSETSGIVNIDKYIGKDIFEKNINEWLKICSDDDEKKSLLNLLKHYLYFPENRFTMELDHIIQKLEENNIDICNTIFITFPAKEGRVSGGSQIASGLEKVLLVAPTDNIIADVEAASDNLMQRLNKVECVVFIDDIIGSGCTVYSRVSKFLERFDIGDKDEKPLLYIASICGREDKIKQKLKDLSKKYKNKFKYINLYPVKKCIDNRDSILDEKGKQYIRKIEKFVEDNALYDKDKSFYMGFEKNQLLVSFSYNTPNNTLSVFWRPSTKGTPLFLRKGKARLTIDNLKQSKQQNTDNAYKMGKVKKDAFDNSKYDTGIY